MSGYIGGKGFCVDYQLLALHRQAPVGNRAELGGEAQKCQKVLNWALYRLTVWVGHLQGMQLVCGAQKRSGLANEQLYLALGHGIAHGLKQQRLGGKHVASVH